MSVVSRRYAKALMNLAVKAGNVDEITKGLDEYADGMAESEDLQNFLADPKVQQAVKESAIAGLLKEAKLPDLLNTFLRFLASKRRSLLAMDIREDFHELADLRMGRAHARVTVAKELTGAQKDQLKKRLETLSGKDVQLNIEVDPNLLGGVVARIGSTVWDASLRNQLNMIEQSILEG